MAALLAVLLSFVSGAWAIDPLCTNTSNLVMKRCPANSVDWYQSYTDIVDNLDALAKTAPSSFTVAGAFGATGSTMTTTTAGIVSATSQPGCRSSRAGSQSLNSTQYIQMFFGDESSNGNYDRNNVHNATSSSGTFTTRGAGIYFLQCCAVFTGHAATTLLSINIADDLSNTNSWALDQNGADSTNTLSRCTQAIASLPDAQNVQCNIRVDSNGVSTAGSVNTRMILQKIW